MQELNRRLFDNRRHDRTACVLLHGQAGGGKSHLARQYVNKKREKFSGGIFWINAEMKEERDHAFWEIHQKVVARESPELCASETGKDFVESVKLWFEARHEWLIVFDGVTVDKDADAIDLQRFVPNSNHSSIIYVSRAKNLESKQRLLRPFPIKVGPLKEENARKLLFKELRIKKPTAAEIERATELVKKIGGLPLAIDAISHRLADTHEPLTKYTIKSYSADPTMGGTYHKILEDLWRLRHVEAWNLIHILCFYGQHIPVEMVHLGLRSLRTYPLEVASHEDGEKADINTTFGILMRYALIERNEPDDKDSMSSSRDSVFDPEPIDMLKIHSVVQKFCCDSLNANDRLPTWLGYAVRLFCYSFNQANIKIKKRSEPGRVSDYRYYLVHGQRLWDHSISKEYESKAQPLDAIRKDLEPILMMINKEIEVREPSSSQETVNRGIFQTSIFDRSSSSESAPSIEGPRTPDHRPTPLPLPKENLYGMVGKTSDSPRSFATTSPVEPRIVDNSPSIRMPPYFQEDGYQGDNEGFHGSQSMQKDPSDMTARPRAPSADAHDEGWHVVPPNRKTPKRRDLGSFRPTPPRTPAQAQLSKTSAVGSVTPPSQESGEPRRPPFDAFASLSEVNHRSPPRSNNGGSFWHRRSSGLPPKQQLSQPTYAAVVQGQSQQFNSRGNVQPPARQRGASPRSGLIEHVRSSSSVGSRQGNARPSSLASEYVPQQDNTGSVLVDSPRFTSPSLADMNIDERNENSHGLQYTLQSSSSSLADSARPRYVNETFQPNYSPPRIQGPNPAPIPLDQDITITTTRHYPFEFKVPYPSPPYPTYLPRPPSQSPRSQQRMPYSSPPSLAGYNSQPMSRHESRHSHNSAAETEPLHQPYSDGFSPHAQVSPFAFPRDRNGQPLRKSPKTADYDFPGHELSGAGGWASPTAVPGGGSDVAMSRSSSGPGFVVAGAGQGGGLGIVRFDGLVQFGEHEPVSVEEARRRAMDHEQHLVHVRDASRGRGRRREPSWNDRQDPRSQSPPYPEVTRIPTSRDPRSLQAVERM